MHGDYGPHNALFRENGEISAVLDWEIATLGDPLADLAYSVNAWVGPGDELADLPNPPTLMSGFPTRQQIIDSYVELTSADVSHLLLLQVVQLLAPGVHPPRRVREIPLGSKKQ